MTEQIELDDMESIIALAREESKNMREEPVITLDAPLPENIFPELNKNNISNAIDNLSENPEQLEKIMNNINPEMLEQAQKLINTSQGDEIKRMLQKKGFNLKKMRKEMKARKKGGGGIIAKENVLMINDSRKIKLVPIEDRDRIITMLGSETISEISDKFAIGPWINREITLWYNPNVKMKNKLSTKILGFNVGNIILSGENLTVADFNVVIKML